MVYSVSADLARALQGSHEMVCQVDVFDADGLRAVNVPIEAGQVSATLLADVSRTGTLTVSRRLVDQGLFNPNWDKVRISTGVRGYPLIPIFTGRVQDNDIDHTDRSVSISLSDFGDDLVNAPFERPWVTRAHQSVLTEMVNIIRDVDTEFTVDLSDTPDGLTPDVAWNDSRTQALDQLATGLNAIWQSTRTGGFIVYRNPYQQATPTPSVLTLSDGPGGALTSLREVRSRGEVWNSITLEVQRADGGTPIRVTVRDNRAASPTRWGGKFGKRNRRIPVSTPYSETDAQRVAKRILGQSLALARSWSLSTPHFPLLDPGDVIAVCYENRIWAQVVESISYPLLALDQTSISTRELVLFNDNAEDQSAGFFPGFTDPADPVPPEGEPEPLFASQLGWSPPNSTTTDLSAMLASYPNPDVIRLYSGAGAGIQSWTGALFNLVPRDAVLVYSIKDWPTDVAAWLSSRPADWTTPFYFCLDHEPEQQDGSDPLPADFRQEWQELIAQLAGHPRRNEIRLCPIFTEFYARRNASWEADFGIVASYAGIDAVGFDIYDTGYSNYRTPVERNDFALSFARGYNKPLIIPEWGIERKTTIDATGTLAAQAMRDNMAHLRQQPDAPYVMWFNRGDDNLDTGDAGGPRVPERQAFIDLMAANNAVPPPTPTILLGMSGTTGLVTQQIVAEYAPQYMRNFGFDGGDADTLPELGSKTANRWVDAPNVTMHTSWKDDVNELSTWLNDLTRPIYITWSPEPHADGLDPATFRATCATMVSIINGHANKALILGNGPIVSRAWLDSGGDPTLWGYTGMTFYGINCYSQDTSAYWTPEQIFQPAFSKVRSAYPGIELMVPEYGLVRIGSDSSGNGRATTIKTHIRWLRTQSDVTAAAYYNANNLLPGMSFTASSPEGQAWKELMAEQ